MSVRFYNFNKRCFMPLRRLLILITLLGSITSKGQVTLTTPRNLEVANEKGTRTNSGKPGAKYWQNTGNYNININFDPATRLLTGKVDIEYVNNSPDNLNQIVFKLYPNIYKKGSIRLMPVKPADITDGVRITSIQSNGATVDSNRLHISGTNMTVPVSA